MMEIYFMMTGIIIGYILNLATSSQELDDESNRIKLKLREVDMDQ
jgi:hypothetical protein